MQQAPEAVPAIRRARAGRELRAPGRLCLRVSKALRACATRHPDTAQQQQLPGVLSVTGATRTGVGRGFLQE